MRYLNFAIGVLSGVALAAAMAFGIFTAQAQTTNLTPNVSTTTLTNAVPLQVVGTNPGRKSIQICNVGTTIVWIWPGPLSPVVSAYELPALSSGTTTCYVPPAFSGGDKGSTVGNSWNAQGVGSSGLISVFEY